MYCKTIAGFDIHYHKEILSTSTEALDLIDLGKISRETVIIADKQIDGRGRNGKSWLSPYGNFYTSLIISQNDKFGECAFVSAIAVGSTLLSLVNDLDIQYKWPNDILVDGKKISGILLEKKSNSHWLVVGIGINVMYAPLQGSTCISNYCRYISNIDLLTKLIINFNKLRSKWVLEGFSDIRQMWLERAFRFNKQVSIKLANQLFHGIFTDIAKDGRLILKQENGNLIYFDAGALL